MQIYLLIFQPPVFRDKPNAETQFYSACLTNLERLIGQRKNLRSLKENCLQISGGDTLGTLQDVIALLPDDTAYSYATLSEEPEWIDKVKTTNTIYGQT